MMDERPQPQRILLVEDDDELRRLFRTALLIEGYVVTEAPDGITALHLLDNETPDLLVLDIQLPGIDGIAIQQELAAHAETQAVPILIVTGTTVTLEHPAVHCTLRKPVSPDELVSKVRECLAKPVARRTEDDLEREAQVRQVLRRGVRKRRKGN